jgi:TIR domain
MNIQSQNPSAPLRVFYSYAREDEAFLMELDKHLGVLNRQGLIASWFDQQLSPGADWSREINDHLKTADIVLLLVSADFMASDYIYQKELQVVLKKHELGEARVIPIILRPIDWENAPFAKIPVLPHGGIPVSEYADQDKAFSDIASGIRQTCEDILLTFRQK